MLYNHVSRAWQFSHILTCSITCFIQKFIKYKISGKLSYYADVGHRSSWLWSVKYLHKIIKEIVSQPSYPIWTNMISNNDIYDNLGEFFNWLSW